MHDLATANDAMQKRMWASLGLKYAGQFAPQDVPEDFIDENYFAQEAPFDPAEMVIYNQYDFTISLSRREADLITSAAPNTQVIYSPTAGDSSRNTANTYAGDPMFAAGANLFNVQGFLYFAGKVMPRVLAKYPAFNLNVAGNASKWLKPQRGTQLLGFVDDISSLYSKAPFAICPLLGGTGQQVKIVEAMSAGVPVICMKNVAESSPIEHGTNGLVASDANEFAEFVLQLHSDRQLCRRLGEAARETICTRFTTSMVCQWLAPMLSETTLPGMRIAV
jgi:hypothetical protein